MIFASTLIYALGKQLGYQGAVEEFHRQLRASGPDTLPAARVMQRLQQLDDVQLMVDPGCTSIPKARCRAFGNAALSPADVWVMVDDDTDATIDTLDLLVQAARQGGGLVLAPCRLREQQRINVALYKLDCDRFLPDGARLIRAHAGGLALAAMSRPAMNSVAEHFRELDGFPVIDHDGSARLALFKELVWNGHWVGEDVAFCGRCAEAGVRVEALANGVTAHAGQGLLLNEIDQMPGLEGTGWKKPYTAPSVRDASAAELLIHSERHRAG
jgi:hypothetical protein